MNYHKQKAPNHQELFNHQTNKLTFATCIRDCMLFFHHLYPMTESDCRQTGESIRITYSMWQRHQDAFSVSRVTPVLVGEVPPFSG